MSIKDATPEEIQAMKARLSRRQSDRLYEAQMDEVVRMVGKHPFPPARAKWSAQTPTVESAVMVAGSAAIAGAAAILSNVGAIRTGTAAILAGAALCGAVSEVARYV